MTDSAPRITIDLIYYRDWARSLSQALVDRNENPRVTLHAHTSTAIACRNADLIYLIGWSEIVPPEFYRNRTVLVLHPSPLPFYRGGSPIQHQIINGEDRSAVSIFRLDEAHPEVDSGPLAWQQGYSLEGTLAQVLGRIRIVGEYGVEATIRAYLDGLLTFWEQPDVLGLYPLKRRTPEESEIHVDDLRALTAREIHDKVRALGAPYPNAYITAADGRKVYITETWLGKDD